MGRKTELLVGFFCLLGLLAGAWVLAICCFAVLVLMFRRRGGNNLQSPTPSGIPLHHLASLGFICLSLGAFASGGFYSPFAFLAAALLAAISPLIARSRFLSELRPVDQSIILRSRLNRLEWVAVAGLKPGGEDFARGAASFSGTMAVFTETAKAYAVVRCWALNRWDAERELIRMLRATASDGPSDPYLLPLDSSEASELLRSRLVMTRLPRDLANDASTLSGVLVMDVKGGRVSGASAYSINGRAPAPAFPSRRVKLRGEMLLWEVLECLGKKARWPEPDSFSNLLVSIRATMGVPLSERFEDMRSAGSAVTVMSLGGERLELTRPQLRAVLSVYS